MDLIIKLLLGLGILIPLIITAILPLAARPVLVTQARRQAFSARVANDRLSELSALQTDLEFNPWSGETWQRVGRLQLDLNQYSQAAASLENAQIRGMLSIEGQTWLADAWISSGDTEKAKQLLRNLSFDEEVDPFVFLQAALIQRSIKDTNGALSTLLRAYEMAPENYEINFQIGLLMAVEQPDKALPFLEQCARLKPESADFCHSLAGEVAEKTEPGTYAVRLLSIGQILSLNDEWDVALLAFQKALDFEPQNGVIWAYTAEALQQNGQNGSEAIAKARELAPEDEVVNGLSGLFYRREGNSNEALKYFEKALEANPQGLVWEIEIANTFAEMGDLDAALKHFEVATEIDPQNYLPWRALAVFCLNHNFQITDIGLPAARQSLELNQGSPALMDLLGTILMASGVLDEAEIYFLQADQIDPRQTAILIHLGQLKLLQGERELALDYFDQAMEYAQDQRLFEAAQKLFYENGGAD